MSYPMNPYALRACAVRLLACAYRLEVKYCWVLYVRYTISWYITNYKLLVHYSLHEGGGPQVGEVTCAKLPHLTCKRDHIEMRDYMDRRVTPPKRVTSPTWGPHLHVNRPLQGSTLRPVGSPMRPAFTQWRLNSHAWSPTWPPRSVTFFFGKTYTNDNLLSFTKLTDS